MPRPRPPSNPSTLGRLIPTDSGHIWLCMGPTCFFTAIPTDIPAVKAHIATCYPPGTIPPQPDYALKAEHGACYTTGAGERRWKCTYCTSDRNTKHLSSIQKHLKSEHGVVTTVARSAELREGQEAAEAEAEALDVMEWVLDSKHGERYVSKGGWIEQPGEKMWRCRYCAHTHPTVPGKLDPIKQHLELKHGVFTTAALWARRGDDAEV